MIRLLKKAAIVAMFVGLGTGAAWGADVDISTGSSDPTPTTPVGADNWYLGASNSSTLGNYEVTGGLVIGSPSNSSLPSQSGTVTLGNMELDAGGSITVTQSGALSNKGMTVTMAGLTVDTNTNASVTVESSGTGANQNVLKIGSVNMNTSHHDNKVLTFNVGGDSSLQFTNGTTYTFGNYYTPVLTTYSNTVKFVLGDTGSGKLANLDFGAGGAIMALGSITGKGIVDGDVTLRSITGVNTDALISVGAGEKQIYNDNVIADFGFVGVGMAGGVGGASEMGVKKDLTVNTNSSINVMANTDGNSLLAVDGTMSLDGVGAYAQASGDAANDTKASIAVGNLDMANTAVFDVNQNGSLIVGNASTTSQVAMLDNATINANVNGQVTFNNKTELGNGASTGLIIATGNGTDWNGSKVTFNNELVINNDNSGIELNNMATLDVAGASANGFVLDKGFIRANGDSKTVVGSKGLALDGTGELIANGGTHSIMWDERHDPAKGATGDVHVKADERIDIANGATLATNNFNVESTVNGDLFKNDNFGTLKVNGYNVAAGADVKNGQNMAIQGRGRAFIEGRQGFAGTNNEFDGGLAVSGDQAEMYTHSGGATISVGTVDTVRNITQQRGATVTATAGETLTFANKNAKEAAWDVYSTSSDTQANLVNGEVVADKSVAGSGGFALQIHGDIDLNQADIYVNTYRQDGGHITEINNANSIVHATDDTRASWISGHDALFEASGEFHGGLNVNNGASLIGNPNSHNYIAGDITDPNKVDVNINNAKIDLTNADLEFRGLKNLNLNGNSQLLVGYDGANVTKLNLTNGTVLANHNLSKQVQFTDTYLKHYYNDVGSFSNALSNPAHQIIDGEVTGTGSWTISNVFGDFGFKYDGTDGAWLTRYNQTDIEDVKQVAGQLGKYWGDEVISYDFAANVSEAAKSILDPTTGMQVIGGSPAGQLNLDILQAFAKNNSTFSSNGINGNLNSGVLSMYNGAMASGPVFVAQDTLRDINSTLHSRLDAYRKFKECGPGAVDAFGSPVAYGSAAQTLNTDRNMNRIWAGGFGTWQNADKRKGFDGYKYEGAGVMLGYDRAIGAAVVGMSATYVEGDYKDKGASHSNSKIKQYAGNVYATYNASSGFYATVMGGYDYADNDMAEVRGGNMARADYHTNTWYAGAKIGYDIEPCDNFNITPSVGVDFLHSRTSGHDVSYANQNTVHYAKMSNHNVEIPVEVKVAYEIPMGQDKGLTLMANAGYAYNLNDKGVYGTLSYNGVTSTPVRAIGRKMGHSSWKGGAGVKFRWNQWDAGVKYDYYGRDKYDAHRLMGTVGYSF